MISTRTRFITLRLAVCLFLLALPFIASQLSGHRRGDSMKPYLERKNRPPLLRTTLRPVTRPRVHVPLKPEDLSPDEEGWHRLVRSDTMRSNCKSENDMTIILGVFVSLGAVILVAMAFYALRIRELKREAKAAFEEANAKKEAAKRAGKSAKKYNPLAAPKDSPKTTPAVVTPGSKKKKYIGKPQTNSPSPVSPSVSGSSSSSSSTTKIPIIIKKVPQKQTPPGSKGKSTIDDAFQVNSTTRRSLSELLSEMSSMSGKMIPPK